MPSRVKRLLEQGSITPPPWLEANLHLEVIMGSRAYGCNDPASSDYDIRGVFTAPKVYAFPATQGLVVGFDELPRCDHWAEAHIKDRDGQREFDFDLHNLTSFLRLAEQNNPNQVDLLFARETQVTHCSAVGRMLLDARKLFLSKLCWKRYRGYAADQWHHVKNKKVLGKRKVLVEQFGYDVKFASHAFRLLNYAEMILSEGDLDLMCCSDELKAIRRGDFTLEQLDSEFAIRKAAVESAYPCSKLPEKPDHDRVRQLLLDCLEHHYGSLNKVVVRPDASVWALRDIDAILDRVRNIL
jgi:hypothetical protein